MKGYKSLCIILICITSNLLVLSSFAQTYEVVEGDTLSKIVEKETLRFSPLYGKSGRLAVILSLNPQIKNPSSIFPHQKIKIGQLMIKKNIKTKTLKIKKVVNRNFIEELNPQKKNNLKTINENNILKLKKQTQVKVKKIQKLKLSLQTGLASISSLDGTTSQVENLASEIGYGVKLQWEYYSIDKMNFSLLSSFKSFKFNIGENKTLADNSILKSNIALGLNYKMNKKNKFSFVAGIEKEFLIEALIDEALYSLSEAIIPVLYFSGQHTLLQFKKDLQFDFIWNLGALLSSIQSDYQTQLGYVYVLGIDSRYSWKSLNLNIAGLYKNKKIKFETANQTSKDLEISVGVEWGF